LKKKYDSVSYGEILSIFQYTTILLQSIESIFVIIIQDGCAIMIAVDAIMDVCNGVNPPFGSQRIRDSS
jgi:hypothetical protein